MPTLHVVIPFYNEGPTIEPCARRVVAAGLPAGWSAAVVIVDDDSEPGHGRALQQIVGELRAQGRRVELRRHDRNLGKGAAVRTGYDAVLGGDPPESDLVVIQDADLEYDPDDYPALMKPVLAGEADAVIGSRFGDHRRTPGLKGRLHTAANAALTALSNRMTGLDLSDMECCYKLLTVDVLRRVRPLLTEQRYGVEPQMVAALGRLGVRVAEVPVSYDPRSAAEGKKIGWLDGVRALWVVMRERRRARRARRSGP